MLKKPFLVLLICCAFSACEKKAITPPPLPESPTRRAEEPIHKLAVDAAERIHETMSQAGADRIQIDLQNHDILPARAFAYLQNSLAAQLAVYQISSAGSDWEFRGSLSKQKGNLTLSFVILKQAVQVSAGTVNVPDDERLRNTLAQFEEPSTTHEHQHAMHPEMPVPTPLAELKNIPLDIAENCSSQDCSLLLLYSNALVERNWRDGTERTLPLPRAGIPSRAPSGKILQLGGIIFITTNNLSAPLSFDPNLAPTNVAWPSRFPSAKPGFNTYTLADGEFFDFQELDSAGMAVVTVKNRLEVADRKNLVTAPDPVGGALCVSLPYIYASSASLPGQRDSILKFRYENGILQLEKTEPFDGTIYDIAITDLNQDGKKEMLVTTKNERGIFVEVHEPF